MPKLLSTYYIAFLKYRRWQVLCTIFFVADNSQKNRPLHHQEERTDLSYKILEVALEALRSKFFKEGGNLLTLRHLMILNCYFTRTLASYSNFCSFKQFSTLFLLLLKIGTRVEIILLAVLKEVKLHPHKTAFWIIVKTSLLVTKTQVFSVCQNRSIDEINTNLFHE